MPDIPKPRVRLKVVKLIRQHIHAGIPHRVGDVIELDHDLADWLVAEGAATAELPADAAEPPESAPLKIPNRKEK